MITSAEEVLVNTLFNSNDNAENAYILDTPLLIWLLILQCAVTAVSPPMPQHGDKHPKIFAKYHRRKVVSKSTVKKFKFRMRVNPFSQDYVSYIISYLHNI